MAVQKLVNESVVMSSVTDCYNPLEEKYKITRSILEQLVDVPCRLTIITKSSLVLRDIDLLTRCKSVEAALSLNTLDGQFRRDMDNADSIENRIHALKELHKNGIYTVLFMSPIWKALALEIEDYCDKNNIKYTNYFYHEELVAAKKRR